jgi:hypothetical protein
MKDDLLKYSTIAHQKEREEAVDHASDRKTNYELNLEARTR